MNERIKELAERHGPSWCIQNQWDQENMQGFVQAIVKECAEVALWEQCKGYDVGEKIKEHFGVE